MTVDWPELAAAQQPPWPDPVVLADAVGGYNEGVDRIIDFIAGDEKEGGSVSMTVKRAVLDLFGRVPIPAQFDEWKKEAGVLYDGSI